jgi:uncharacterized protein (TIGR00369 family)
MTEATEPTAATEVPDSRSRSYRWQEPLAAAREGQALGGVAYLQAIMEGRVAPPPIAATLDFVLREVGAGRAVFTCRPAEFHYNPLGTVHGGLAATLIDSATGCAVQSVCPPGHGWTTLELKVNFVRPMTKETGEIRCEGRLIHGGSRIATAEAKVVDATGRLYAHGSSTCLIFPLAKP